MSTKRALEWGHMFKIVLVLCLCCCVSLAFSAFSALGQEQKTADQGPTTREARREPQGEAGRDCARCHTCEEPTAEDKCLRLCTREKAERHPADYLGPAVVMLNELEDAYLPVPFDHRGHAEMAEMAEGCGTCHHYTPEGQAHPACKTCHEVSGAGTDIAKPCLKGAYHRQCLNCHKDWIDETDCIKCHMLKAGQPVGGGAAAQLTKDDILGRMHPLGQMHPPIPEPDTEVYDIRSKPAEGSQVIFRHREHVRRFGLKCVECHYKESCTRCHMQEREQQRPRAPSEHHKPCVRCHGSDAGEADAELAAGCKRCHWWPGEQQPQPFDHASTGWPLSRYHAPLGCRSCHKKVPMRKLAGDCTACHDTWGPGTFNHAITGQILDANHTEIECEECHIDGKFDRPPRCDECHDEEEGISFPARRPGLFVGVRRPAVGTTRSGGAR